MHIFQQVVSESPAKGAPKSPVSSPPRRTSPRKAELKSPTNPKPPKAKTAWNVCVAH